MADLAASPERTAWTISAVATVAWLSVVSSAGWWGRVAQHWESAATMVFGSFLAGSSPEGGGAVAFPVFTKVLGVSAPVARSFGLSIQAVGMTMAAVAIVVCRRPVHRRAILVATPAAVAGFFAAVALWGRSDEVFWPMALSSGWIKASFSIVLATTSMLMVRHLRGVRLPPTRWTPGYDLALVVAAFAGGVLSALAGTGANVMVFLVLVTIVGIDARVALPTAIVVMAVVSTVGLVLFGIIDGQLDVSVANQTVTSVGGVPTALDVDTSDLLGLWLAAVPVVLWGAPLGSWVASLVAERLLVGFVAVLAGVEVLTTFVLVDELRTSAALIAYFLVGLVTLPAAFIVLARNRTRLLR